ncbi:MAG: hypothetical protein LUI05_07755 [Oscillospiraceae bacterium]|nr:hypothetical protein [Oscillospiraceae bacterium]
MKKIIALCLALALALPIIGCTSDQDNENTPPSTEKWYIEGFYLKCDNGADMIIADPVGANPAYPCTMQPNDDTILFTDLTDGDRIKIEVYLVEEAYPAQTTVYSIEKISDGERADIPSDIISSLSELGWVN